MNITTSLLLHLLSDTNDLTIIHKNPSSLSNEQNRLLQSLPDYTSPPTQNAIDATPYPYKDDYVIDYARDASEANLCMELDPSACQIIFEPGYQFEDSSSPSLGVLFYGGALVDPRGYSPLAKDLSERYGMAVSIPIFHNDIAFSGCTSDRIELARLAFPTVEKWIMAGHSMGGIGVMSEVWSALSSEEDESGIADIIGGFALIASYVRQDVGCGATDFTNHSIPTASISGSLDGVINIENWSVGQSLLPKNDSFHMVIPGANHGNFGSYDYSLRKTILGQNDGNATIPKQIQHDLTVTAIMHVVARAGIPLPVISNSMKKRKNSKKDKKRKKEKGKKNL